jgi:hypothetical protein
MELEDPSKFGMYGALIAVGFLAGMLVFQELGRRAALRWMAQQGTTPPPGTGAVDGASFALLGLLLAFTFSGAASRFDVRRQQIVQEANDIGTAWLRLDLLPADSQPALRELFRQYLDSRLAAYQKLPDLVAARQELARANALQTQIWTRARTAANATGQVPPPTLLLPALNAMFDIATTRTMAAQMHQPPLIFALLFILGLGCAALVGFDMADRRGRSWIHLFGFAAVVAVCTYVIIDLEYPRLGLIHLDSMDQALVTLRASMQ